MGWIVICFQLAQHIDQNTSIKHGLTVHFGNNVLDFLERQTLSKVKCHILKLIAFKGANLTMKRLTLNFSIMFWAPWSCIPSNVISDDSACIKKRDE